MTHDSVPFPGLWGDSYQHGKGTTEEHHLLFFGTPIHDLSGIVSNPKPLGPSHRERKVGKLGI